MGFGIHIKHNDPLENQVLEGVDYGDFDEFTGTYSAIPPEPTGFGYLTLPSQPTGLTYGETTPLSPPQPTGFNYG